MDRRRAGVRRRAVPDRRLIAVEARNPLTFSPTVAVLLALIGFAVGAFGTIVGSGGGFILTPVLLLLYPHDDPATLTAISLTAVCFNAISGSAAYAHQRRIDYRSGLTFATAALPGSILGALAVGAISRGAFDAIMAAVLLALATWLVLGEPGAAAAPRRGAVQRELTDRYGRRFAYQVPIRRGAAYSAVVGFASSFLGIGGGVIHVPLLVRVLGFPTHIATATSHFILAIIAGTGAATHVLTGSFAHGHGVKRAIAISIGVVLGAQLGARLSLRASGRIVEAMLAVALIGLAVRLIVGVA
jgi:uncharacterized protein